MFKNMSFKFFADNKPSPLKATQKELDSVIQNYLTQRNDSTPLENFKEGKRFFKGVAATMGQINLFRDQVAGRFSKKGLQSLLSDFDYQGIAVRVDHEDRSLAVGKVFDANVVTKNGQTRLEAFFWIDGNEPVLAKMDSGTYSELSVSFGGFNKLSCGECGVEVDMEKLWESVYYSYEDKENPTCSNGHVLNDPKTNFVYMDNCKPLSEISVVYSGRVRDTSIVKLSRNESTSLQNNEEDLQLTSKFSINGEFSVMDPKELKTDEGTSNVLTGQNILEIIQERADFKAQLSIKDKDLGIEKDKVESLNAQVTALSAELDQLKVDLQAEKDSISQFSKKAEDYDSLVARLGVSGEGWQEKVVAKFLKAEETNAQAPEKVSQVFDTVSLSALSKFKRN